MVVLLSFCPSFRLFGIVSLVFSKFCHGARNPYEVARDIAGFFQKKIFYPQNREKWTTDFFEFIEKFGHEFLLNFSIMKSYISCCVPAQIPYLGKFLFLRYGPKCCQPIRLQYLLINHISRTNQ